MDPVEGFNCVGFLLMKCISLPGMGHVTGQQRPKQCPPCGKNYLHAKKIAPLFSLKHLTPQENMDYFFNPEIKYITKSFSKKLLVYIRFQFMVLFFFFPSHMYVGCDSSRMGTNAFLFCEICSRFALHFDKIVRLSLYEYTANLPMYCCSFVYRH